MKIVGKIIYIIWAVIIAISLCFYCFSCYVGFQTQKIIHSAVSSMGQDYNAYRDTIADYDYLRMWHQKPNNASYDRVTIEEDCLEQEYSITRPYILIFQDKGSSIFSLARVGYIYNNEMVDVIGNKTNLVAEKNSKVVLDVKYEGFKVKVTGIVYDNDFNEFGISRFHGLWLLIILLINAIARNIRYFDRCIINRKQKNIFRFIQPYLFSIIIAISFIYDALPLALVIGIAEELIFTLTFMIIDKKTISKWDSLFNLLNI